MKQGGTLNPPDSGASSLMAGEAQACPCEGELRALEQTHRAAETGEDGAACVKCREPCRQDTRRSTARGQDLTPGPRLRKLLRGQSREAVPCLSPSQPWRPGVGASHPQGAPPPPDPEGSLGPRVNRS